MKVNLRSNVAGAGGGMNINQNCDADHELHCACSQQHGGLLVIIAS